MTRKEIAMAKLIEAAKLGRNIIIYDNPQFEGEWVAVPREDFDALRTAVDLVTSEES